MGVPIVIVHQLYIRFKTGKTGFQIYYTRNWNHWNASHKIQQTNHSQITDDTIHRNTLARITKLLRPM